MFKVKQLGQQGDDKKGGVEGERSRNKLGQTLWRWATKRSTDGARSAAPRSQFEELTISYSQIRLDFRFNASKLMTRVATRYTKSQELASAIIHELTDGSAGLKQRLSFNLWCRQWAFQVSRNRWCSWSRIRPACFFLNFSPIMLEFFSHDRDHTCTHNSRVNNLEYDGISPLKVLLRNPTIRYAISTLHVTTIVSYELCSCFKV